MNDISINEEIAETIFWFNKCRDGGELFWSDLTKKNKDEYRELAKKIQKIIIDRVKV